MKLKALVSLALAGITAVAVSSYADEPYDVGQQSALDEFSSYSQSNDIFGGLDESSSSSSALTWYFPDGSVAYDNRSSYFPDDFVAYGGSPDMLGWEYWEYPDGIGTYDPSVS